jgi:hypothetical protein
MKPGPYLRGVYRFKPPSPEILEKFFSIQKFAVNTIGKAHIKYKFKSLKLGVSDCRF